LFVSGKNLHTWTKWAGFDPESVQTNVDTTRPDDALPVGIYAGARPVLRAFTIGLNITY